jgi:hypothetical protein
LTSDEKEVTLEPSVIRFGSDSAKEAVFYLTVTRNESDTTVVPLNEASIKFELIGSNSKNYKLNRTSYTFDITNKPVQPEEDDATKKNETLEETFFKLLSVKVTDRDIH